MQKGWKEVEIKDRVFTILKIFNSNEAGRSWKKAFTSNSIEDFLFLWPSQRLFIFTKLRLWAKQKEIPKF